MIQVQKNLFFILQQSLPANGGQEDVGVQLYISRLACSIVMAIVK